MRRTLEISLTPRLASNEAYYKSIIAKKLRIPERKISFIRILRKSIDARKGNIKINLRLLVYFNEPAPGQGKRKFFYQDVSNREEVIVIGAGPAGLFAALRLIELGKKPVILERGKEVSERKKDIALISKEQIINPESNYCFGEGGAGTFSDGKLYTRSRKRGDVKRILEIFHFHGAPENILYESFPHIGTNRLPGIIKNIRNSILNAGGEIHFNTKVTDLFIRNHEVEGVLTHRFDKIQGRAVILA
ncbi:MAG: FAD-binding protein, partial [Bacteroidales bacterium]|nr:FAD-binding protein [Bacteroidales bacterium]